MTKSSTIDAGNFEAWIKNTLHSFKTGPGRPSLVRLFQTLGATNMSSYYRSAARWAIATLFLSLAQVCQANSRLVCHADDKQYAWVQRIEIDPVRREAHLEVAWSLPVVAAELGKLEAIVEDMTQSQDGVPVYAFNAYPQAPTALTNMFKLARLAGR